MSILVVCPACACKLKVPERMAGEKVACPKCAQRLIVSGQQPAILDAKVVPPPPRATQSGYPVGAKAVAVTGDLEPGRPAGHGWSLAVGLAGGSAVLAAGVLGFALLRNKPSPTNDAPAEAKGSTVVAVANHEQATSEAKKPESSQNPSKKRGRSSTSKKESEGDDPAPASSSRADAGQRVYKNLLKSAAFIINVEVLGNRRKVVTSGSGSLVDRANRLVLTNFHVVGDSAKVIVFFPEYRSRKLVAEKSVFFDMIREKSNPAPVGTVVARSTRADLALVQLDALPEGLVPLNLAKRGAVPGQRVHSIGNPGDSDALWLYTSGTVRQVLRQKWKAKGLGKIYDFDAEVVETQSPTNPGDSGGPLVNDQGDLIAVTEGGHTESQLLSTFIHVDEVRALLDSFGRGTANSGETESGTPSTSGRKRRPSKP
jgi:S1-C subfamily serine protease